MAEVQGQEIKSQAAPDSPSGLSAGMEALGLDGCCVCTNPIVAGDSFISLCGFPSHAIHRKCAWGWSNVQHKIGGVFSCPSCRQPAQPLVLSYASTPVGASDCKQFKDNLQRFTPIQVPDSKALAKIEPDKLDRKQFRALIAKRDLKRDRVPLLTKIIGKLKKEQARQLKAAIRQKKLLDEIAHINIAARLQDEALLADEADAMKGAPQADFI
jgi:hypothetical protein